jgi:hypothetical protein
MISNEQEIIATNAAAGATYTAKSLVMSLRTNKNPIKKGKNVRNDHQGLVAVFPHSSHIG